MDNDSRKFYRADFQVKGIFNRNGKTYPILVKNISLKGILAKLENHEEINIGDNGEITVYLPNSVITLIISDTSVVHKSPENLFGFEFNQIDAESMIHLRRLLELNSEFEGEIEQELPNLRKE
jgi:hypothetical protein